MTNKKIRVVELFAGVGGFRIGLEGASDAYETVWNNQWEPSTQHQDASLVYQARFGKKGHCNKDINTVPTNEIPDHDLLVGGFPCQDYSVAATLSRSGGIEGKKGVLWWQIYRILNEKGEKRPRFIFFENVDRLLNSPATQRGRDFAIILASLSDLGYVVEWRIINAADYGMPQRRRRTYIVGYQKDSVVAQKIENMEDWVEFDGVMAKAFPFRVKDKSVSDFNIDGTIQEVSAGFNKGKKDSPFGNAGLMIDRHVYSVDADPVYDGPRQTLGGNLIDEDLVPEEFFISDEDLPKWEYEKGAKKIERVSKEGFKYMFSEGGMAFPDSLDQPSRTIITGEGGNSPSRFKHVVKTKSGRYRRLLPIELERMNMFPDNHTFHPSVSDGRRAFLMGNALVCGIVEQIGKSLYQFIFDEAPVSSNPIFTARDAKPMLDLGLFADEQEPLVVNRPKKQYSLDSTKHLLIGLVKKDNEEYFLKEEPTKIYYTGKTNTFPSTVAINKLYYFMPYIKEKGVRDLYLIRVARIGNKAEIHPESKDEEPRLVFELEYLESLPDYQMLSLNRYWFKDTLLGRIIKDIKKHDLEAEMDKLSPEQRHRTMAAIRGKDTKPEMIVRKGLWSRGFRYRLNSPRLPGHPDLVLKKYRTCIFVNGCFWHGHNVEVRSEEGEVKSSECCKIPNTRREFWVAKIKRNQERDIETQKRLAEMGWHCITIWECELKPSKREQTLKSLVFTLNKIWLEEHAVIGKPYPQFEEEDGMLKAAEEQI